MLSPGVDPYRILGINAATPTASIRKLRLRLAQLYHPDIGDSTANSAKMAELNAAYDSVMRDRDTAGR
jgi:DnaJ-class molecular chaperone